MLRERPPRAKLRSQLAECERLVLLGDVIELRHGPVHDSMAAAEAPLRELGGALPPTAEVVIVPGNHDHHLLHGWSERRSRWGGPAPLSLETAIDWVAGEPLAALAGWFGPRRVRACYPGVWLRDDVYATHGHYCDRQTTVPMLERLGAGVMARIVSEAESGPSSPEDYEATLAPLYAWIHAVAQQGGPELGRSSHGASAQAWRVLAGSGARRTARRRVLAAGFPLLIAVLNRSGLGPLRADLSGPELRRAGLQACAEVCRRLEIGARYVIFGHTHRSGPLPGDDRSEWSAPGGTELVNAGCWVNEPSFLGPDPASSPYRPGFAVTLDADGPPALSCLLDPGPA